MVETPPRKGFIVNETYRKLFEPVTLGNGVTLDNRLAMAPMLVFASHEDGSIAKDDFDYFTLRNDTGALIITGAAAVSEEGLGIISQLTVYDDAKVPGLTELAAIIKAKGNRAILQLHHAGREAYGAHELYGKVLAPSAIAFPFLPYVPEELTHDQILGIIDDYAQATRRAIEAGFDGVEIHGANHYLLQQFFSAYSNTRSDQWGGSFDKRMAFPLAVLEAVLTAAGQAGPEFIVGYRISPEEVHGDNVGYTVDDAVQLISKVIDGGAHYIHVSTANYKVTPTTDNRNEPLAATIHSGIAGRVPMLLAGNILNPDDALDALNYTDIVALGRAVLIDPDFVPKLRAGQPELIETSVAGRLDKLALSKRLIGFWLIEGTPLAPLKGLTDK